MVRHAETVMRLTEVLTLPRLGEIHGMEISRRGRHHEQDSLQGSRSHRGSRNIIADRGTLDLQQRRFRRMHIWFDI